MPALTLLVVSNPAARYLSALEKLPPETRIVVGNQMDMFRAAAPEADAILHCLNPGLALRDVFLAAPGARWVHSMTAGVENTLFPELISSAVPFTNSRGVFKRSLAEFALTGILFFAKDFRRMLRNQEAGVWDPFDVEEIHGKTLGIVGYGEIGRAAAANARALGMRIHALRRRPELSSSDHMAEKTYAVEDRKAMLAECDYVLVAAPLTAETRGLIGEAEIAVMKPSAVVMNVGRGPVIDEAALVAALRERRIRGAALDVFDQEPLPEGHAFYKLDNVLLSPHCADHVPGWLEGAMQFFLDNFERFRKGEPLQNVVDKRSGY